VLSNDFSQHVGKYWIGENISDDLHTDNPMMTSAVTPANNDVMPIVQRVQRNIIDDRQQKVT